MEKIDLDIILDSIDESYWVDDDGVQVISTKGARELAKKAIYQALILASKKAKNIISINSNSDLGSKKAIEQSILDVNDLVV